MIGRTLEQLAFAGETKEKLHCALREHEGTFGFSPSEQEAQLWSEKRNVLMEELGRIRGLVP